MVSQTSPTLASMSQEEQALLKSELTANGYQVEVSPTGTWTATKGGMVSGFWDLETLQEFFVQQGLEPRWDADGNFQRFSRPGEMPALPPGGSLEPVDTSGPLLGPEPAGGPTAPGGTTPFPSGGPKIVRAPDGALWEEIPGTPQGLDALGDPDPKKPATPPTYRRYTPQKQTPGPDQIVPAESIGGPAGYYVTINDKGKAQGAPFRPAEAAQQTLDMQIAELIDKGDIEGAQKVYDFKNQMTPAEQAEYGLRARQQALEIGSSPGDWWTYMTRIADKTSASQPFQVGARSNQGFAGGLIDPVTGQPFAGGYSGFGTGGQGGEQKAPASPFAAGPSYEQGGTPETAPGVAPAQPYPLGPDFRGGGTPESPTQPEAASPFAPPRYPVPDQTRAEQERYDLEAQGGVPFQQGLLAGASPANPLTPAGGKVDLPGGGYAFGRGSVPTEAERYQDEQFAKHQAAQGQAVAPSMGLAPGETRVGGSGLIRKPGGGFREETFAEQRARLSQAGTPVANSGLLALPGGGFREAGGAAPASPFAPASSQSTTPGGFQVPPRLATVFRGEQPGQARLLTALGGPGGSAPPFLSPQTLSQMLASEREMYGAEVKAQGFYGPDYEQQRRKQFGGFSGGTAGGGARSGGRISTTGRYLGRL